MKIFIVSFFVAVYKKTGTQKPPQKLIFKISQNKNPKSKKAKFDFENLV